MRMLSPRKSFMASDHSALSLAVTHPVPAARHNNNSNPFMDGLPSEMVRMG
jgi:hypothetical protein